MPRVHVKGPSRHRQLQLMQEAGLQLSVEQLAELSVLDEVALKADEPRLVHGKHVRQPSELAIYSWTKRPAPKGPPQIATPPDCPNCFGNGCSEKAVRIDDDHYCVEGLKLTRTEAWRLKQVHVVSQDKERTLEVTIPAILKLHRALNLDLSNLDVRQHETS